MRFYKSKSTLIAAVLASLIKALLVLEVTRASLRSSIKEIGTTFLINHPSMICVNEGKGV